MSSRKAYMSQLSIFLSLLFHYYSEEQCALLPKQYLFLGYEIYERTCLMGELWKLCIQDYVWQYTGLTATQPFCL